ncbi:protein NPAT isoform X2 [Genypterus blacodes]|uniref:protein NPAT isoform X2 n=1 Tax=Genypterus blacodes TaxID=154954 RepID=UPI003F75F333
MLLPSDVARLVLGYLQEEGMSATTQAFILESPNLKEYAEHTTEDGTVPACVFSVFGKGLATILNEYVAAKAKETCHEVPAMMTSLWKKLDFTLNQIKSLQNSPALSAYQRTRSRVGAANIRRQRALSLTPAGSVTCPIIPGTSTIISPVLTPHSMLGHSTPVSFTATHNRPASAGGTLLQEGGRLLTTCRDSPVQILITEHRLTPGPMSPGRRKWDTPKKRSSAPSENTGLSRATAAVSGLPAESQPEEQLVIQNARDRILGDRSLQEKLAENINKILANEPVPQTSKALSNTVEPDQSIDEILGLQGEIHMSDDAIQDILEQTESDPAFQALFDLFDYHKTRLNEGEPGDGPEEGDIAGTLPTDRPAQIEDSGTPNISDANASDASATPVIGKMRAGQERKTRKHAGPISLRKTILGPSGKSSRIENSSAKLLVSQAEPRGVSPATLDKKLNYSVLSISTSVSPMDIDEPLNTPPPPPSCNIPSQEAPGAVTKDNTPTSAPPSVSTTISSSVLRNVYAGPETLLVSNVDKIQVAKRVPRAKVQPATNPPRAVSAKADFIPPVAVRTDKSQTQTADLPHITLSVPNTGGHLQTLFTHSLLAPISSSSSATATATASSTSASTAAPPIAPSQRPPSILAPVPPAPDPLSSSHSAPNNGVTDPDNIVSLKIIISDNQEEQPSNDLALNQAISSISRETIPTIYLSSPAKSPACPGTSKISLDEIAQAVSGLQSSEALQPVAEAKTGAVVTSTIAGTTGPSYIIQLPLDAANPALQGAAASYILVTEPPAADAQARQALAPAGMTKGPPLAGNQRVAISPRPQVYSTGSALILQSPVQPMVIPVSVMGQNPLGKLQMVSNQFVAVPNPVQQSETVKSQAPTVAVKQPVTTGVTVNIEENVNNKVAQPLSVEQTDPKNVPVGRGHRRILCFEPSGEDQPHTDQTSTTATLPAVNNPTILSNQPKAVNSKLAQRTKPIPGSNKPKRRVETVRCSEDTQFGSKFAEDTEESLPPQQHQDDAMKKNNFNIQSKAHASQTESLKKTESRKRSKSIDRKHSTDKDGNETKAMESHGSRTLSSDCFGKSGSRKEKEKEPADKAPTKSHEGRPEKKTSSQETPSVMANKENEIKGSAQEQQQQSTSTSSAQRDLSPPAVAVPIKIAQSKSTKPASKTTSLAKQAAEMLQDMQGLNSPSTPVKKPGIGGSDPPLPRIPVPGHNQEELTEGHRTPSRQRKGKDGDGTPKRLMPPSTPDVPTCSPSSEAGSENSINMAAHTLMILSRAAIARTGTPLKDSLRQQGVGGKSPTASKLSKKRKHSSPTGSPPAKKEVKQSPKKKDRDRKKLMDCFPHDLDVDKFLSSLHYDE